MIFWTYRFTSDWCYISLPRLLFCLHTFVLAMFLVVSFGCSQGFMLCTCAAPLSEDNAAFRLNIEIYIFPNWRATIIDLMSFPIHMKSTFKILVSLCRRVVLSLVWDANLPPCALKVRGWVILAWATLLASKIRLFFRPISIWYCCYCSHVFLRSFFAVYLPQMELMEKNLRTIILFTFFSEFCRQLGSFSW